MAIFDIKTFKELKGGSNDPFSALKTSFGVPECLLGLTAKDIRYLPFPLLSDIQSLNLEGSSRADEVLKKFFKKILLFTSIMEVATESGNLIFVSDSSEFGLDADGSKKKDRIGALKNSMSPSIFPLLPVPGDVVGKIKECLGVLEDVTCFTGGNSVNERKALEAINKNKSAELLASRFKSEKEAADSASKFLEKSDNLDTLIDDELIKRVSDPSREPKFDCSLEESLSGLGFEFCPKEDEGDQEEVFRLVFGPPRSTTGKFLLSQDGLYYDSQVSGITPALLRISELSSKIEDSQRWRLDFDPNLGGRGTAIDKSHLIEYVDTLFDPEVEDNSEAMEDFYFEDRLLMTLIGQKDKRIHDLSAHIDAFITSGSSEAIIANSRQSLMSEAAVFDSKIRKRKKQIELAVKLPAIYGNGRSVFAKGEIPINDFSYMKDLNLAIKVPKQKQLVLDQEDVSGVVKPLAPIFVHSPQVDNQESYDHLYIPNVGEGSIIFSDKDPLETSAPQVSITDVVITDELVAMYNFLRSDVVGPSSTDFYMQNDASLRATTNAQLVAVDSSSVYTDGLSIPYLKGIAEHASGTETPSSLGSYCRLPDTKEFQDLMYGNKGFTIESWVHVPYINSELSGWNEDNGTSSLYRIILGNENTGLKAGASAPEDYLNMHDDFSNKVTRGFLMGFTRDRRITKDEYPSNASGHNISTSSLAFFLAPTQSMDSSTIGFTKRDTSDECQTGSSWRCMKVDTSTVVGDVSFSSVCNEFVHVAVSVDILDNTVKIYLDNTLMATSSVTDVFGVDPGRPVSLPTFKQDNSFAYSQFGPPLDTFFTPWVIGGGYSDGLPGGFMGGDYGGKKSGLMGNIGSMKFYRKPLTAGDVSHNFLSQKSLFKNVDMTSTCDSDPT